MFRSCVGWLWCFALLAPAAAFAGGTARHVIVVVWDGMRPDFVSQEHTPTLKGLADRGVFFGNHHSVYCSATEVNGTAIATGAYPEHSGIIANREFRPQIDSRRSVAMENLSVMRRGDEASGGHYLQRPTLAETLQSAGKTTAIAGTKPVALMHDRRDRADGLFPGVVLFEGKSLPPSVMVTVTNRLGLFPPAATNGPNLRRDEWTTRALLGPLWSNSVPAFSLLWLSEPDFSQHADGPGSPRALAALESSDRQLAAVLAELESRGLRDDTDVFIVSDHGFSTVETSVNVAATARTAGFSAASELPPAPKRGDILVVSQGGSVLFYIVDHDRKTARRLAAFLQEQTFSGVIFARDRIDGTFPLEAARLRSEDAPDLVLSLRWSADPSRIGVPGLMASDGGRPPGGGNHASLSRFDLHNTLIAAGPDFKRGFKDAMPSGNVDVAPTILWLLNVKPTVPMDGRVLSEALALADVPPAVEHPVERLEATRVLPNGAWHQYLQISRVNDTRYLDEGNGVQRPR